MAGGYYSDDDDFYEQDFQEKAFFRFWLGISTRGEDNNVDMLQDLCGVGFYRLSEQETNHLDYQLVDIASLLADPSYSTTYVNKVVPAAREKGIEKGAMGCCAI